MMSKAPKHSKNRFAGTARPSGTKSRWITSPLFQPKHTITVGHHVYRFSESGYVYINTPDFKERVKEIVSERKREALDRGKVLIARYMYYGSSYGYVLYVRDIRPKRPRPDEKEAVFGRKIPIDTFPDKQLRFSKSKLRDRKERRVKNS